MQNFVYYAPTEVIFGKDAEAQTAAAVSRWNGSRVLIVYGGGSVRRSASWTRLISPGRRSAACSPIPASPWPRRA